MSYTLRRCMTAAALVGGVALLTPPASANSLHNEGNFGGSYSRIAPSSSYGYRRHAGRVVHRGYYGPRYGYYGPGYADGPGYAYGYGPGYAYGPGITYSGPGFAVGIGAY